MAHFAQLDESNVVLQVIVIANDELIDSDGFELEQKGIDFCKTLFGEDTVWKQTSYNGKIRKNYAGIGFIYDEALNAFVPPQPYPSWLLNPDTAQWESPIPYPKDGKLHRWDEPTLSWIEVPSNEIV